MYPTTSDNRQIVMTSLFPAGVYLSFTGAGDSVSAGRGKGTPFVVATAVMGTNVVPFQFNDFVYLAGGSATWDNAMVGDTINLGVAAPATTFTSASGSGNATLVAGTNAIVPAAGNGNINIVNAVPVPHTAAGSGAWAWVPNAYAVPAPYLAGGAWPQDGSIPAIPPTGMGQLVPVPQNYDCQVNWTYDLWPAAVPLATFVTNMQIVGSRQKEMTLPAIKPQMVLPHWVITATINSAAARAVTSPLIVSWNLTVARLVTAP